MYHGYYCRSTERTTWSGKFVHGYRFKILYDGDDLLNSPIGPLIRAVYKRFDIGLENIYPVTALPVLGLPRYISYLTFCLARMFHLFLC